MSASAYSKDYGKSGPPSEVSGKVLIGLSGREDSAVTAALLKSQGYDLVAVHLQFGDKRTEEFKSKCNFNAPVDHLKAFCKKLDIPLHVVPAHEIFEAAVMDHFVHQSMFGRAPSPCNRCHLKVKIGTLFDMAEKYGCTFVATGHYVQIKKDEGSAILMRASDPTVDQSYYLYGIQPEQLDRLLTPLGTLTKKNVTKLAKSFDFEFAKNVEDHEFCFVTSPEYPAFVDKRITPNLTPKGVLRTVEGTVIGDHGGIHRHYIGQSKGLDVTIKENPQESFYVVEFDAAHNAVIVGQEHDLLRKAVIAEKVNWLGDPNKLRSIRCQGKIGPAHAAADCEVIRFSNDAVRVIFEKKQHTVIPGRPIVLYDGDQIIGGGLISKVVNEF